MEKHAGPIAATALSFGATHALLKLSPCHRRLERVFARRQSKGLLAPAANPSTLAAQTESRILNELFNIIVVPLSVAAVFQAPLNRDRVSGCTKLGHFLTVMSAGYFCTETAIICRNFNQHGFEPLAHAVVCIAFFCTVAVKQKLQFFVPRVLLFEFSTPFVHFRWLLAALGLTNTRLYTINGIAMIAAFFVCRVAWGTRLVLSFLREARVIAGAAAVARPIGRGTMRVICTTAVGISCLNYYWFYKMMRGAFKLLARARRRKPSPSTSVEPATGDAANNSHSTSVH